MNQPPKIYSLVEKWRGRHNPCEERCAEELEALLKEQEEWLEGEYVMVGIVWKRICEYIIGLSSGK